MANSWKHLTYQFAKCLLGFLSALEIAGCSDDVVIQQISSSARLEQGQSLKNSMADCAVMLTESKNSPKLFAEYPLCRFEKKEGESSLLFVSEQVQVLGATDSFSAIDFVLEVPGKMQSGRINLPNDKLKVFAHNCRHFWLESTGCFFGSDATGYVDIKLTGPDVGRAEVHVTVRGDGRIYGKNEEWLKGMWINLIINSRAKIGSDMPMSTYRRKAIPNLPVKFEQTQE